EVAETGSVDQGAPISISSSDAGSTIHLPETSTEFPADSPDISSVEISTPASVPSFHAVPPSPPVSPWARGVLDFLNRPVRYVCRDLLAMVGAFSVLRWMLRTAMRDRRRRISGRVIRDSLPKANSEMEMDDFTLTETGPVGPPTESQPDVPPVRFHSFRRY
ncbi:MAG: hypothetical protein Q4C47_05885, partial [Planctomycetia bacterium]|nr:hypothetical protein [Planctomycetia bacterium]